MEVCGIPQKFAEVWKSLQKSAEVCGKSAEVCRKSLQKTAKRCNVAGPEPPAARRRRNRRAELKTSPGAPERVQNRQGLARDCWAAPLNCSERRRRETRKRPPRPRGISSSPSVAAPLVRGRNYPSRVCEANGGARCDQKGPSRRATPPTSAVALGSPASALDAAPATSTISTAPARPATTATPRPPPRARPPLPRRDRAEAENEAHHDCDIEFGSPDRGAENCAHRDCDAGNGAQRYCEADSALRRDQASRSHRAAPSTSATEEADPPPPPTPGPRLHRYFHCTRATGAARAPTPNATNQAAAATQGLDYKEPKTARHDSDVEDGPPDCEAENGARRD